jgi:transglutaminase-like putative cysteine protease
MRLHVHHTTHYEYEILPSYLVQRLHLQPADFEGQRNIDWAITAPGIENGLVYRDSIGNWVHLVTCKPETQSLTIVAEGEVETENKAGVVRGLPIAVPETIFFRNSNFTQLDERLKDFAASMPKSSDVLDRAHSIMTAVHASVAYQLGASDTLTTAAQAFAAGRGVCQDHAHIMLAVSRHLGVPARYVTGYLVTGQGASSTAAHAWAELFVPQLGWVGFDAANGQCPTDHYVRVAAGLDAAAAAPVRGSRRGNYSEERLRVEVRVEISQQ